VSCYAVQPFGTLGDVGRGSVVGPGLLELDSSLIKNTKLWERLDLQFRAEFFNVLNHTNLALPTNGVTVGAPAASIITPFVGLPGDTAAIEGTSTTSRQIQFALKLTF
jgi:hypothetical protein